MTNTGKRGRPPHGDVLTPSEWRVAEAIRHGITNPEIAARLGVSLDAVKHHVANSLQPHAVLPTAQRAPAGELAAAAALDDKLLKLAVGGHGVRQPFDAAELVGLASVGLGYSEGRKRNRLLHD